MLEYLDNNLLTMNNNLLKANFDRILESIWVEVIEEFREALETEEMVCVCICFGGFRGTEFSAKRLGCI